MGVTRKVARSTSKTEALSHPGPSRIERDAMGELGVPSSAYYGIQTARAICNFPISNLRFPRSFIRALGLIKGNAAKANAELKLLDLRKSQAIQRAALEVVAGDLDHEFPVDIFQTGSGTSTNMNANEVIANRASELLGGQRGSRVVHPNDHVNLGQSSNDVIPTAIHVAAVEMIHQQLNPALRRLYAALRVKTRTFDRVVKIGRTHLQDATPIRLGQEFGGYARQVELAIGRAKHAQLALQELALGGTAVGTGLNAHPQFAKRVISFISKDIHYPLKEAANHFEAQAAQDSLVEASGALRVIATSLMKIANDLRWLGSGPRCGFGEISLPETQPGSSIMPGKVNPVIAESLMMVSVQVLGNDTTVAMAGQFGNFELLVMLPVMAYNLLQSIELLAHGVDNFTERCVKGITANREVCGKAIEKSLAMCTSLAPEIGYEAAAGIAKESYRTGKTVREIAQVRGILSDARLKELLDPWRMTGAKRRM